MDAKYRTLRVDPEQFCSLALSRRTLIRSDDDEKGERGLLDTKEQIRYVVTELQLLNRIRRSPLPLQSS